MGLFKSDSGRTMLPAVTLLLAALLFLGACSDDTQDNSGNNPPEGETEVVSSTTSPPTTGLETTVASSPPEVTLDDGTGGGPEVLIRLEGDPETAFSGLCSVGQEQNVLSGQVPKRFEFDLQGRRLSCRIEKQDGGRGDLKVVLVAGETTRSVQQTNSPGDVIRVAYRG